jgi:hypothetical protein
MVSAQVLHKYWLLVILETDVSWKLLTSFGQRENSNTSYHLSWMYVSHK